MNYDIEMQNMIEKINGTPNILLHSCCAPCSSAVIERLSEHFNITILYYNPNIEPYEEYEKRKKEEESFIKSIHTKNKLDMIDADYNHEAFENLAKNHENDPERGARCYRCYKERLTYTFKKAQEFGYDYFATTLTLSPYKVTSWINEIGLSLSTDKTKYLPSDFKKRNGYKRSIELSKKYDLYRQDYCGCKYSHVKRDNKITS